MAKTPKDHLQDIFDDLGEDDLKKFKVKLRDRKEEPIVRQAKIDKAKDRLDLTDLMVNTFTLEGAVSITLEILKSIDCNELAKELEKLTKDAFSVVPKPGPRPPSDEQHFIDRNWTELVKRVHNVNAILDELLLKKVITDEDYSSIRAERTPQNQMREVLRGPIKSAGIRGKDALYEALKVTNSFLIQELEDQGK